MPKKIWIVILASGFSSRMGKQKLFMPIHGESMIRFIVKKALESSAHDIVVICNSMENRMKEELAGLAVHLVTNPHASEGLSSSLHQGISFICEHEADAGLVLLGDQPGIQTSVIVEMIQQYMEQPFLLGQAQYKDQSGHPVLFDRSLFSELLEISGDKGAKEVIKKYSQQVKRFVVEDKMPMDIDTQEDYVTYLNGK